MTVLFEERSTKYEKEKTHTIKIVSILTTYAGNHSESGLTNTRDWSTVASTCECVNDTGFTLRTVNCDGCYTRMSSARCRTLEDTEKLELCLSENLLFLRRKATRA